MWRSRSTKRAWSSKPRRFRNPVRVSSIAIVPSRPYITPTSESRTTRTTLAVATVSSLPTYQLMLNRLAENALRNASSAEVAKATPIHTCSLLGRRRVTTSTAVSALTAMITGAAPWVHSAVKRP